MKNNIEIIRFGPHSEFYAIAERSNGGSTEDPTSLKIFESGDSLKELHVIGRSNIQDLQKFLNGLYEPAPEVKHPIDCACEPCDEHRRREDMLQKTQYILKGLEVNRVKEKPWLVHLDPLGGLHSDIRKLLMDIEEELR